MTKFLIVASLVCSNAFATASPPVEMAPADRDAELIAALETLSTRFMFHRPRHRVVAVQYNANGFFAVLGAAALVGLRYYHPQLQRVLPERVLGHLAPVKSFADRLDRRAVYALAAYLIYTKAMAARHVALNDREVQAMRASLASGDQEYAANLAQFFELTRAEQFLIAKRDPLFAEALVAYAEYVRTREFQMESRFYPRAHLWDEISAPARKKSEPAID